MSNAPDSQVARAQTDADLGAGGSVRLLEKALDGALPPPTVPPHLAPFVVQQHYHLYTAVDHAVWRFVNRQNIRALRGRVHEAYLDHFFETGMEEDSVPDVRRMSQHLHAFGWKAVAVDGFIPPGVFMDFQAHGLLPIAQDIRTLEHLGYTPAPDIIHEAAGHAPLILDPYFASFLRYVGELGAKALSSREDVEVYEAIRQLSILKEDPHATPAQVEASEVRLELAIQSNRSVSEASLLSRLYWWTVEYGLIGSLERPLIYGAGLCSSLSEGAACLEPSVKKLPFSLECIDYAYDITRPQPQLFVTESFERLFVVAQEFSERMAFKRGGTESLEKALASGQVSTVEYESGLQVSGIVAGLHKNSAGDAVLFVTRGPSALAYGDLELAGHSIRDHQDGLVCPIGLPEGLEAVRGPLSQSQLEGVGLKPGTAVHLNFPSGLRVSGLLQEFICSADRVLGLALRAARISHGSLVIDRDRCSLPLGASIPSVYAGSADRSHFVVERRRSQVVNRRAPATELERDRERLYHIVREERRVPAEARAGALWLSGVAEDLEARHQTDWLLRLEVLELLVQRGWNVSLQKRLREQLEALKAHSQDYARYITCGLELLLEQAQAAA